VGRLLVIVLTLLGSANSATAAVAPARRPNILFILTDDQGWTTLGCYGNTLAPTPHLDALARDGVKFTDAYVMPQCTPTRAFQAALRTWLGSVGAEIPGSNPHCDPARPLKEARAKPAHLQRP
jgi:hypothetical protein